jgi:maltodextrin utilization protein YvdJ
MLAILAAILAGVAAILAAAGALQSSGLLSPWFLLFVILFLVSLHLVWPLAIPGRRA